jgi:hypothetical protein
LNDLEPHEYCILFSALPLFLSGCKIKNEEDWISSDTIDLVHFLILAIFARRFNMSDGTMTKRFVDFQSKLFEFRADYLSQEED